MPHAHHGSVDVVGEAEAMSRDEPLFQCIAYKATRLSEIVCKRTVTLFKDRFTTAHQDLSGEKCWYLDRSCKLEPEYVEEILVPEKRSVRPPGAWTVTAKLGTVTGSGQSIELYCVTLNWPTSWLATRGYTAFTLGFETAQAAGQWHAHVQRQISLLRLRTNSLKGDTSISHSPKPSYDDARSVACSGGGPIARKPSQDKGFIASALEHWLGSKEDRPAAGDDAGILQPQGMQYRMPTSPVQIPIPSRPSSTSNLAYAGDMQDDSDVTTAGAEKVYVTEAPDIDHSVDSYSSSLTEQPFAVASPDEQRWVPYRHTNGVAIYHHKESKCLVVGGSGETAEEPGSEYMASSIVRGSPDECLAVLMDMSSNTTILGPASKIELLEEADERQVLRFSVEATGMARHLCAPREIIVERVFKREECGVDVVLFSSCDPAPSSPLARTRTKRSESQPSPTSAATAPSSWRRASSSHSSRLGKLPVSVTGVVAAAAAVVAAAAIPSASAAVLIVALLVFVIAAVCLWVASARRRVVSSSSGGSSKRSCSPTSCSAHTGHRTWREWLHCVAAGGSLMWYKPVRAYVQGGYTISPREDCIGVNSPECLVTCILKVDLGGCLGERSWLRPFAAALGWVDAYVERMLMAVILVKDEVEQRRFLVQPFSMLTNTARTSAEQAYDDAATDSSSTVDEQQEQQARVLRQQSTRRRQQQSIQGRELSLRWQVAGAGDRQAEGLYGGPYGHDHTAGYVGQQQGSAVRQGMQAGSAADLARQASRKQQTAQQKQKGRLGRMASRIYALRPRVLRGSDRQQPHVVGLQPAGQLGTNSISFSKQMPAGPIQPSTPPADAQYPTPFAVGAVDASGVVSAIDLSDPKQLLTSLGMPAATVVVDPSYYVGGPQGPAAVDSTLNKKYWSELHTPGTPAPFKVRGATYLEDRNKVDGGTPQFVLGSVDLVETPGPTQHISRFLPAVRGNQAAYSFVVNLIIPGTPVLSLVAVFINEHHPDILDGVPSSASSRSDQPELGRTSHISTSSSSVMNGSQRPATGRSTTASAMAVDGSVMDDSRQGSRGVSSSDDAGMASSAVSFTRNTEYERPSDTNDWQPFDYCLHRFLHGGDETRTSMFKLIPHIAEGSWVIKQSVGTVPVIMGTKLKTVYYQTDRYIEACVDVTSSSAAAYITGMVRGATKSLVIDLGFILEGQRAEELPEALLGAFRLNHLDCTTAQRIDTSRELPLLPRPLQHHQLVALQQQAQQGLLTTAAVGPSAPGNLGSDGFITAGSAAGLSWQSSELPSSNGAVPAADHQPGGDRAEQQSSSVQQMQQLHNLAQQLQQRWRNSIGVVETGRTMTGHARSRSAASVEELISSGNSPRAPVTTSKLQPKVPLLAHSNSASPALTGASQHQRHGSGGSTSAAVGGVATPRQAMTGTSSGSSILHDRGTATASTNVGGSQSLPVSARTSGAAVAASSAVPAASSSSAHEAVAGSNGSFLINATPAKQLFSSFLNLTSTDRGSGGKGSTTVSIDAEAGHSGAAGRGNNSSHPAPTVLQAHGPVASASTGSPATAGAGMTSLDPPAAVGGSGSGRGHQAAAGSTATPAGGSGHRSHHHRSSSNSDSKGSGGAGWPTSPPSADWSSKMSAAAYISRAHASALAASAQRRTQQHQGHKAAQQSASAATAAETPPAASHHGSLGGDAGPGRSGATATHLPPSSGGLVEGSGSTAEGSGGLLSKRPRTSSTGSTAIRTTFDRDRDSSRDSLLQQQQQGQFGVAEGERGVDHAAHVGSSGAGGSGYSSGHHIGHKISASEQLRLAQQTLRISSTSGGQPSHHYSTSSSSSLSGAGTGSKQLVGPANAAAAVSGGAAPLLVQPQQQQSQQPKRQFSHRRFASMGAVQ